MIHAQLFIVVRMLLNSLTHSSMFHLYLSVIIGAREVDCESLDDVMTLLESGSAMRQTGSTQMNEHSSRSHSIFTVVIGKWI